MDKQDPLKNLNEIINDTKAAIETGYITEPGFINAINSLDLSKSLGSFNISQINELSALFSELNGTRFDNQFDKARTLSVLSGTIDKINEITGDGLNDLLRNLDRSDPDSVERYNEAISGLFDQLRQQPDLAAFGDVFNVLESVLGGAKVAVEDYESQYSNFLTLAETGGMTTGQTALGKAVESLKTGLAEGTVNSKLFNEALSLVFGDTRPKNLENSLSSIEKLFATGEGSAEKMFGELGKYVEDGHVNMKKLRDELNLSDAAFGALKEKIRDMGLSTANKEDINLIGDGLGISNKDVVGFENEASNLVDEYKTGTKTLEEYSNAVDELAQRYGVADDSLDTFRRNMRRMATGRYEISDRESGAIGTMTSFLGIDGDLGNSIEDRISEAQRSLAEGLNSGDKIDYSQVFNTKELMSSIEGDLRSSGEYVESEIQSIMKELESRVSTVRMDTAIEATVSDLKILSDDKPAIEQAIKDAYDTETQTFDIPKLVANIQGIELKQQGDPTKIKNQIFQSLGLVSDGAGGWTAGSDGGLITVKTTAALGSLEAVAGSASSLQEQLNNIAAGTYTIKMPHTQVQSAEGAALSLKYTLQNLTANPWVVNVEYRQTGSPPSSGGSSSTPSVINPPESEPGGGVELYGNAFAGGTIGARRDEVALGGEVGQEIVVDARRGTWRTIGDRGAEFFKVNKGDIIFNAKQTKELLKYGYTNSYGKAYLGGNAYVTTLPGGSYSSNSSSNDSAPTGSKSKDKTPKSSKGSDNDAAKEVAEEFKKVIENIEHEVFLAQKRGASPQELEKLYADMISVSEKYASQLRGMGEDDLTSEHLHEVQKQWWDAWDSITELLEEARDRLKEAINLSSSWRDDAFARGDIEAAQQNTDNIDKYYQESQNSIVEQINRFVGAGFSENSKEVLELKQEWQELEDDRIENNSDMHEAYRDMIEERIDVMSGWRDDAIAKGDIDLIRENTTNMSQAYENAQNDVLKEIEFYRNLGYSDESKEISELLNKHKEYESDRLDIVKEGYEAERSIRENSIALSQKQMSSAIDNGDNAKVTELTDNIVNKNKEMQESLHKQAEYYRSLGYAETSEELTELGEQWWEYQEEIDAALEESYTSVIEHTKSMLDSIRNAYDSLKGHAEEYAETGNISVDLITTLSEIGAEYINYLKNEDGQLVINRKSIERLIAAQTEHLAVDSAYAYVMKIKAALEKADTEELSELTTANYKAAESTWELVYASLELLNLDDDQYKSALRNIHSIRALANQARVDIGKESAEMSQKNEDNKDALEELLDLTMELIKYEKEEEIDALNEQIDKYQEIISLKKESIQESKKESDYNKDIADKLKDISELQSRIDRLSLDDSREAQAEKKSLEEELSDLQKDFADFQADYSVDKQTEALDKELEAFEDEKKEEIEIIEESISSTEKLYQLALKRIEDDWDTLVSDIIKWNYDAGNSVEDDIVDKLQLAIDKVKEFSGSYKDAMQSIEDYEEEEHDIIGDYHDYGDPAPIKAQMKANSLEYFISSEDKQDNLSRLNRQLATQLEKIYGKNIIPINGSWYVEGSEDPIYTLEVHEILDYITDAMYKNAQALHTASEDVRSELAIANERMATYIEEVSQRKIRKDGDDVWWIDDVKLFESYGSITPRPEVHHNGGVVGESRSAKDNEVLTLLENGEMVLNNSKKESLYDYMDIATYMMNKFGAVIEGITSSSSFVPHLLSDGLEKLISGSSSTALSNIANANQNVTIENVEVIAPIQVVQKLDESDIKEHSRTIGELSSRYIRESLSRKGIVPAISSI